MLALPEPLLEVRPSAKGYVPTTLAEFQQQPIIQVGTLRHHEENSLPQSHTLVSGGTRTPVQSPHNHAHQGLHVWLAYSKHSINVGGEASWHHQQESASSTPGLQEQAETGSQGRRAWISGAALALQAL